MTARLLTSAHIGVPTLDFRLTFFAPTKVGAVFAVGRLVRAGRRVAFIEADLYDEKSELLSRMSVTALIIRSEEHTSELQLLMRNSYAVFCLQKKNTINTRDKHKSSISSQQLYS